MIVLYISKPKMIIFTRPKPRMIIFTIPIPWDGMRFDLLHELG